MRIVRTLVTRVLLYTLECYAEYSLALVWKPAPAANNERTVALRSDGNAAGRRLCC